MSEPRKNFATDCPASARVAEPGGEKPRIESQRLFHGANEIIIVHRHEEYNLRITRNGKLILTK
ncbi:MAG: hemin uptake protein HemP [Candidatus Binatia bacterium]